MRFRPLHLAVLIFQAIWLNAIVPGHQRGVILVPGSAGSVVAGGICPDCQSPTPGRDSSSKQPKNASGNCAICFFAAHMGLPPVIDWPLTPLGLLHRLEAERVERRLPGIVILPFDCRGPPAV